MGIFIVMQLELESNVNKQKHMHENTTNGKQTIELPGQRIMNTEITDCLQNDVNRSKPEKTDS